MTDRATENTADGSDRDAARRPLLDLLREGGAEMDATSSPATVSSFGSVEEEYRALVGSAALVDDTDRALIRVTAGRKEGRAHETLSGLLTNRFETAEPGNALYSFLLTAKGSPVAELRAIRRRDDEDWLDLPAACREGTLAHLEKYLPPLFAAFRTDDSVGRLGLVGPRAGEALRSAAPDLGVDALEPLQGTTGRVAGADALVLRRDAADAAGFDLYVPLARAPAVWRDLRDAVRDAGGGPAGRRAREIRRVELGLPVYGREIDQGTLPQETGQTGRAVSFEKGCYTGQEVVVRIEHRGQVNRHLRGLELDAGGGGSGGASGGSGGGPAGSPEEAAELPGQGAPLYDGERERGSVTTAVRSPRHGPIALAYVRREVEPGSLLSLSAGGEPSCRVRELPFGE